MSMKREGALSVTSISVRPLNAGRAGIKGGVDTVGGWLRGVGELAPRHRAHRSYRSGGLLFRLRGDGREQRRAGEQAGGKGLGNHAEILPCDEFAFVPQMRVGNREFRPA